MGIQVTGTMNGAHSIEVEMDLPFEDGAKVLIDIVSAVAAEEELAGRNPSWLRETVGLAGSGLSDVSANKHEYLAGAYGVHNTKSEG